MQLELERIDFDPARLLPDLLASKIASLQGIVTSSIPETRANFMKRTTEVTLEKEGFVVRMNAEGIRENAENALRREDPWQEYRAGVMSSVASELAEVEL